MSTIFTIPTAIVMVYINIIFGLLLVPLLLIINKRSPTWLRGASLGFLILTSIILIGLMNSVDTGGIWLIFVGPIVIIVATIIGSIIGIIYGKIKSKIV